MPPHPYEAWSFLPVGYLMTVAVEIPILLVGLSRHHSVGRRLLAGFWLTACTYPIVVLVLPYIVWEPCGRVVYVAVAEIFAPMAECGLFMLAFYDRESSTGRNRIRDLAAIVAANVASFLLGVVIFW